jgi:hypothetical protein
MWICATCDAKESICAFSVGEQKFFTDVVRAQYFVDVVSEEAQSKRSKTRKK